MSICQAAGTIRLARLNSSVLCLVFSVILISDGCSSRRPGKPRDGIIHVVKRGENLFRIGKAYDIRYDVLARINKIADPHQIRAGDKVFVPGATRQLPVEIITPANAVVRKRGSTTNRRGEGAGRFLWPVKGTVTSRFGPRNPTFHDGIDISARSGTPIRASRAGTVIYSDKLRGYGNLIIIRHTGGFVSVYAHNRRNLLREGQKVARGQVVAEVGDTGRVSGPHLHFEIRKNNIAQDPLYYLP